MPDVSESISAVELISSSLCEPCPARLTGPKAYIKSWWNLLDMFVVAVSLALEVESSSHSTQLVSLRALRLLRCLRPLRMVSQFPGMRLCVNALFVSIPAIFNVFVVMALFFFMVGVVCVDVFKGGLRACRWSDDVAFNSAVIAVLEFPVAFSALPGPALSFFK